MEIKKNLNKTLGFDPNKCNDLFTELLEVYRKYKPTVGEILISLGNLTYALGASVGKYKEKGPSIEELKRIYYSEPGKIDIALMLQGIMISSWFEDYKEIKEKNIQKEDEKNES